MTEHLTETELNDLVDGRLAPDERERAERHLAECARCARERGALAAVVAAGRSARGSVTAPPELWALVAASTIHERLLRRHVMRSMRGVLLVAALALILATMIVTILVSGRLPSGGPPPPRAPAAPAAPAGDGVSGGGERIRGVEADLRRLDEARRKADERGRAAEEQARKAGER